MFESIASGVRVRRFALASLRAALVIATALWASSAQAKPVLYTAFAVTDGSLGDWQFRNARVYLYFRGDTDDVEFVQPLIDPTQPDFGTVDAYIISKGTASVVVVSGQRVVRARFDPGQIFVSMDLGDTLDAPHFGGRGVGFGSFSATAPGGLEVSYPLGIEDGTLDWGDIVEGGTGDLASPALPALSTDLQHDTAFSGRAWSCIGFPDWTCPAPTTPLTTDHGDFYLNQPYQAIFDGFPDDVMSAGFFVVDASDGCDRDVAAPFAPLAPPRSRRSGSPITYTAYTVTDVTLGRHHYTAAQVYLSLDSDASAVVPLDGTRGWVNDVGRARVTVVSDGEVIAADLLPHQIYAYLDLDHGQAGLGSYAGGLGYPLSLTSESGSFSSLTSTNTLGAMVDLSLNPGNAASYTPRTADLVTDLTRATALSGAASSCTALDPSDSSCNGLVPVPLHTTRGDLRVFEPYTETHADPPSLPISVNWGLFWIEPGSGHRRDRED